MEILKTCVQDTVTGTIWLAQGKHTLVISQSEMVLKGKVIAKGNFILRYGIPYLGPQHLSLMPAVFEAESGATLEGIKAWKFMLKNYQMYPRAEVIGLRSDGDEVEAYMKELDFADYPRVYVYESPDKKVPLAQIQHVVSDRKTGIPPILKNILPPEVMEK